MNLLNVHETRRTLRQPPAASSPRPDDALSSACLNLVAKAIGDTGTAPKYARASFRVRVDGRVFEYAAMLKLVGGAA